MYAESVSNLEQRDIRREPTRSRLPQPRTPGHMAGPVLASAYCRYGCPAGQSGSQWLGVLLREFVAAMTAGVKSV
jgi:hypothetical protein